MKKLAKQGSLNFRFALLAMLSLLGVSCQPSAPEFVSDYDVVYTNYERSFDFGAVRTYFLPDTVVHAVPPGETADHRFDDQILSSLETNLNALGWTRLNESAGTGADVVILPNVSEQAYGSCATYCWYCDWGWYPGWGAYSPGWGPGRGWGYPSGIVCGSYATGTVVVNITAPSIARDSTLPVVWVGILNGLLEGSDASINTRIGRNIDQMFRQSAYLKN
ncbi:DUF4136 domain-containing protein [Flavihumibacter cheonanensis]|uniref:DUF4136 domain-containing protein n=1 Tax=Flavihumibacter cheonanensis TaxID=1442385 RepID=UPI001EF984D6|nr:DUF4136 domain-containing protein [Flavihumibacter cheonanensis]MCG7753040.1 DUF4136 domain-containing protein [Flavihumibacter cheonanensis]